ncbi:MAG: histidinol dehydrogenase [Leptospirales bacterium]|nr:histidinol dehydrogenase [Leptospirales bacterium]
MVDIKNIKDLTGSELDKLFNRFGDDFSSIMINTVAPIVNEVRTDGDKAVKKYTEKFDGVKLNEIMASREEIERGFNSVPKNVIEAFTAAKNNIEEFHLHQKRDTIMYERDGTILGIMPQPIDSAAIYVPGGKASYPSSVLMGVIPAMIAGVKDISVITPPDKSGSVAAPILAVCKILGVEKIIKAGGAQGIAAAGLGTETVAKAEIIVGPGNIYVTAAKTYLFSLGVIQIDSLAGPSEVLIIADESANPKWVAFDFLSQAEHEEMAVAVLVTTSQKLAEEVKKEIEKDINSLSGRHEIKKAALKNSLILVASSIEEAIDFSNRYGPEHMEFMVRSPLDYLYSIKNVGSLFLGDYAPVAVGDYFSGTNHILPTGGAARFSSGTSVETFTRTTTFQYLNKEALSRAKDAINIMSEAEGFADKHGGSVNVRFEK